MTLPGVNPLQEKLVTGTFAINHTLTYLNVLMTGQFIPDTTVYSLSERAVTLQFGNVIGDGLIAKVNSFNHLLLKYPFPGFISAVPAYSTLSVFFNPFEVYSNTALPGADGFEKVSAYLLNLLDQVEDSNLKNENNIEIPVCYGDKYGFDLDELAELHKLSPDEIISLHSQTVYTVGMIGFVPGFAYLTGLTTKLYSPRRESPRKTVPAGSVGIAGMQTGIYSLQTPGGWQIIGCTPIIMFDASRPRPALLQNGDKVTFKPVSAEEFESIKHTTHADKHS